MSSETRPRMQRIASQVATLSARDVLHVVVTAACIALAANVSMRIPNTPVPITGHTVVVIAAAILLGPSKATTAVGVYLTVGALGAPVFAGGASTSALIGPTAGYLLSYVPAAWLVGHAACHTWTRSMIGTIVLALIAHAGILFVGSITLGLFIGMQSAWTSGIAPFITGSVMKSVLVGLVSCSFRSRFTGDCTYGPR